MADVDNDMNFWGHLDALRRVVMRIALVVVVLATVLFFYMPWIFDHVIAAPCEASFVTYHLFDFIKGDGTWIPDMADADFHVNLINIELASQFFIHMSASCWMAFVISFPVILYLLWSFVSPALYDNERRGARRAFVWGNVLFYTGVLVGYFIIFPLALRFLADYRLSDKIANTVSLTSYVDTFFMLVLMMGLLFELPILAWLLGKVGVIHRTFFRKYRKYAVVAILVISGIVTPTSDLFTLLMVFIPIYLLWEGSSLLVPEKT